MNDHQGTTADRRTVLAEIDKIQDLPTIPHVLLEINKMLRDAEVSNSRMQDVIEKDQVITAKVLRLVNSPFYGHRSGIADISQALMIMGFNAVRNTVATVAAIDVFRMKVRYDRFDIRDLWKHSIAVAVASRHLAEKTGIAPPSDCFIAGLLHDIGKLVMVRHLQDDFNRVLSLQQREELPFIAAEKRLLPVDHAVIGGYLVRKWHFPARLADAIEHHHEVLRSVEDFPLHVCIYAANTIVNHRFLETCSEEIRLACPEYPSVMSLIDGFDAWRSAVEDEIENVCQAF